MTMCKSCVASLCLAVAATAPQAAVAQQTTVVTAPTDSFTEKVGYADLDLRSPSGRQALLSRVGKAVNSVCSDALGPSPIFYAQTSCRNWTWAHSRPQVDRAFDRAAALSDRGAAVTAAAMVIVVSGPRGD